MTSSSPQSPGTEADKDSPRLVLASASPRRRTLLQDAGYDFEVHPADINEDAHPANLSPGDLAEWLAVQKSQVIAMRFPSSTVLAADTVVAFGDNLLGKPDDAAHAGEMLRLLSGTAHLVVTGITVMRASDGFKRSGQVISQVSMRLMSADEIERYIATGDWQGKAGGFGIQDHDPFVTRISGSFTNIVGLPMEEVAALLAEAGITPTR